jgi:hypothetical protein
MGYYMILHDEQGLPFPINSIKQSVHSNYIWCLDLSILDYTLKPITILEENTCNTIVLSINNNIVQMPAFWYILVCDPETTQIDCVQASTLSNNTFYALVYGSEMAQTELKPITVIDWIPSDVNVYPTITRNLMLCHDVGDNKWVSISFSDTYSRFLKNKFSIDLVS